MPLPLNPASTPTFGKKNWVLVATIAAASKIPTVAEMTATSSFDMTDVMFAEGSDKPTKNTNRTEAMRRWGQTDQFERRGTTQYTGGNVTYAVAAQGAPLSDGRKMYERIPEGTTGFLVERLGVGKGTDFAAGQSVNVYPVEFDESQVMEVGEGENAESGAMTSFFILSKPVFLKAITA